MFNVHNPKTLVVVKKLNQVPWYTYFCSLTADLLMISTGMQISWYSPAFTKLLSNDSIVNPFGEPISMMQISILSILPSLAAVIMYIPWAKVLNTIGAKKTMRIMATIHICNLITIAFARNIIVYYVFLPLIGITAYGGVLALTVYNTEIAQDSHRGTINCIMSLHMPIGILIGYILGSVYSLKNSSLISTTPSIIFILLSLLIPESPYHLIFKQKNTEGYKALETLRGRKNVSEIELEYNKIKLTIDNDMLLRKLTKISDFVRCKSIRKAFLISTQLFIVEQLSGISFILGYVTVIFSKAGTGLSGDIVGILVGITKLVSFFPAVYYIDKLGRKTLILSSIFGCSVLMLLLGIFFYLDHIGSNLIGNIRWISILFTLIYILSYGIGLGNVPLAFAGEIFPKDVRSAGVATTLIIDTLVLSIVTFSFPLVSTTLGLHWCFWICAAASSIGFISIYFTMPETKGKSFLEIQNLLEN
ncbi:facilitated trehalose transporter Tret1-like [Diorhabda carinulata]|uniref:facilitated trehalose transporter Tret1-like n=1 Tax=Diorhabda carinulata TaxID=1163345 RepID=UPI0025A2DB09|nr:facilitated trehalose transporter Tret1-like [Diorhabda carinulata]